ncbi:MAG: hypothetical protein AB8B72_08565, partial [Crocinitomicaceae bacterium]
MKYILNLIISFFIVSTASANEPIIIKLKILKDSVELFDSLESSRTYNTYTDCYQFENPTDSNYLNLSVDWFVDGSYMMSVLKCSPAYTFVDSIPDGIYKIIINNKPVEQASIRNGMRSGLTFLYKKRPYGFNNYGSPSLSHKSFYFVQNFNDDVVTEYYSLDTKFNVIEYLPVTKDSLEYETRVKYYFDEKGRLRAFGFDDQFYFYFTQKFKYIKTESYTIEIEIDELRKGSIPNGLKEINFGSKVLKINFSSGVILNWQVRFDTNYTRKT